MEGYSKNYFETSIRVITFSGKKTDWSTWEEKFLAKSKRRGYKELLLEKDGVQIPKSTETLDEKDEDDKKKITLRELNESGYTDLILSMDTDTAPGKIAFNIVKKSKTKEYEDGNIQVAWKNLKRKYSPKTAPTLASTHKKFYGSSLRSGMDPDVYLTFLEDLRGRMAEMDSEMTDDQFSLHALANLPKEYTHQVEVLEKRIGSKVEPLTLQDIREELDLRFLRIKDEAKGGKHQDMDDEEYAMYAGGRARDKCNHCGKFGHKSADCYSKGKGKHNSVLDGNKHHDKNHDRKGKKPMLGKCYNCGVVGHPAFLCHKKKKGKKGDATDMANAATDGADD